LSYFKRGSVALKATMIGATFTESIPVAAPRGLQVSHLNVSRDLKISLREFTAARDGVVSRSEIR
jgi:hypothetical protein